MEKHRRQPLLRNLLLAAAVAVSALRHASRPTPHHCMQVTTETEELRYNTAIAAMMEFVNGVLKWGDRPRAALEPFLLLLAPYAPHLAEEMWASIGHSSSLTYSQWPQHDESLLVLDSINLAVQVGGRPGWLGGRGGGGLLQWLASALVLLGAQAQALFVSAPA